MPMPAHDETSNHTPRLSRQCLIADYLITHLKLPVVFLFFVLPALFTVTPAIAAEYVDHDDANIMSVGVLAFRGKQHAMNKWGPTIEYLDQTVQEKDFRMLPLDLDYLDEAVSAGLLDFVITNPGNYVSLESRYGISRIATLQNIYNDNRYTRYGAVIISHANNKNIETLADLHGKRFMAISPNAFGGYQMAWLQLRSAGIEPVKDFEQITYSGFPQDKVVYAVLNGEVDAGTVRAETLARMGKEKKIDPNSIRILNPQRSENYPFEHSTELYPEWAFAKSRHTSDEIARKVSIALLNYGTSEFTGMRADYSWTIPLDYSPVHELFKELKISPYDDMANISLREILKRYSGWITAVIALLAVMALTISYITRINQRLRISRQQLTQHQHVLEERVEERTTELNKANLALQKDIEIRQQVEETLRNSKVILQSIHEITTDHSLSFEDKIKQLLVAGCEHFGLDEGRFTRINEQTYRVIYHYDARVKSFMPPVELDINQTVCNLTVKQSEILAVKQAADIDASDRIIFEQNKVQCYVGTPVFEDNSVYGTLCFSSPAVRTEDFSPVDHDILQLISQWISGELELQRITSMANLHQRELEHAARLGTLGELATGLAHELNQPLTAIRNYLTGFQRRLGRPETELEKIAPAIDKAVTEAERAANIIKQMRELIQKRELRHEKLSINDAIQNSIDIIKAADESAHKIHYSVELDRNCPAIVADRVQLEQVIINLLVNSRDALHECSYPGEIHIGSGFNDSHIIVEISDNGPGVDEQDIVNIFSPFHTSKPEGLGLGLSICRTIIESYHGTISAHNNEEGGLVVKLHLPYSDD